MPQPAPEPSRRPVDLMSGSFFSPLLIGCNELANGFDGLFCFLCTANGCEVRRSCLPLPPAE